MTRQAVSYFKLWLLLANGFVGGESEKLSCATRYAVYVARVALGFVSMRFEAHDASVAR